MSTVFEVYTTMKDAPSFNDVLTLSNEYLNAVLRRHNIDDSYVIDVSLIKEKTHKVIPFDKSSPALWAIDDEYAWFTVNEQPGGCDAYVYDFSDYFNFEQWYEDFIDDSQAKVSKAYMQKCFDSGFYWAFRCSAGQPAIISLAYGVVAAAFTELTNGLIFSDDGAWDSAIFPTSADCFLQSYFNPQYSNPEYANWAGECISNINNAV
jgi:hypothetical protein